MATFMRSMMPDFEQLHAPSLSHSWKNGCCATRPKCDLAATEKIWRTAPLEYSRLLSAGPLGLGYVSRLPKPTVVRVTLCDELDTDFAKRFYVRAAQFLTCTVSTVDLAVSGHVWKNLGESINRAEQEKISSGVASFPAITRAKKVAEKETHKLKMTSLEASTYANVVHIVCAAASVGLYEIISSDMSANDDESEEDDEPGESSHVVPGTNAIRGRDTDGKMKNTRAGVRVKFDNDAIRDYFDAAELKEGRVVATLRAPPLCDTIGPMHSSPINELFGSTRHTRLMPPVQLGAATALDVARRRFLGKLAEAASGCDVNPVDDATTPMQWSSSLRHMVEEYVAANAENPVLAGFCKPGEAAMFGKLPRLIGNPGPKEAGRTAVFAHPLEVLFKRMYSSRLLKGRTIEGNDGFILELLKKCPAACVFLSIDFVAFDSSYTPAEKEFIRQCMRLVAEHAVDAVWKDVSFPRTFAYQDKIHWRLRFIEVILDVQCEVLFSGERATSIGNRITVMMICWAIMLQQSQAAFDSTSALDKPLDDNGHLDINDLSERYAHDTGDGDDLLWRVPKEWVRNVEWLKQKFDSFGKEITVAVTTPAQGVEVLSRYHMWRPDGVTIHLSKPDRAMQRLEILCSNQLEVDEKSGVPMVLWTRAFHTECATMLLLQAPLHAQTPGLRWLVLAYARFHLTSAQKLGKNRVEAQFSSEKDRLRLGWGDFTGQGLAREQDLEKCYLSVVDYVSGHEVYPHLMPELLNSGFEPPQFEAAKSAWEDFESYAREFVLCEEHFSTPGMLIDMLGIRQLRVPLALRVTGSKPHLASEVGPSRCFAKAKAELSAMQARSRAPRATAHSCDGSESGASSLGGAGRKSGERGVRRTKPGKPAAKAAGATHSPGDGAATSGVAPARSTVSVATGSFAASGQFRSPPGLAVQHSAGMPGSANDRGFLSTTFSSSCPAAGVGFYPSLDGTRWTNPVTACPVNSHWVPTDGMMQASDYMSRQAHRFTGPM